MNAQDIMTTQVITVNLRVTIQEVLVMMVELSISGLVVTDDDQNVVGVISERDIMVAYDMFGDIKGTIENFVNTKVIGVAPDTSVLEINRIMIQSNIKRVPVIENGKCVGIISRGDILKHILNSNLKRYT